MKKTVICALLFAVVLLFFACEKDTPSDTKDTIAIETPKPNPPMQLPEFPIIDGSSSTITMHAAIRAFLTDAYITVGHSQTYDALERLVPGNDNPADVILAVKYYDDTLQDVKNRGADLIITPIAKEGFVFIVHETNPVKSLTRQQLKDIYSGKIKNWKEVGGKDQEIYLIGRNLDSGSETAMLNFMGDTPLTSDEYFHAPSMGFMLDAVSNTWEHGGAAIGYTIYSWSIEQFLDEKSIRILEVNDVLPSDETLADDSYPLLVYTYSYYNKGNDKGKKLTDWLLTDEGQKVIASAGYVGVFGEIPTYEPIDFYKDNNKSCAIAEDYYKNNGYYNNEFYDIKMMANHPKTEALADGKGKDVTIMYFFFYAQKEGDEITTRFIVLTREKGGEFEIINEGEFK